LPLLLLYPSLEPLVAARLVWLTTHSRDGSGLYWVVADAEATPAVCSRFTVATSPRQFRRDARDGRVLRGAVAGGESRAEVEARFSRIGDVVVLELLARLVEKSLVVSEEDERGGGATGCWRRFGSTRGTDCWKAARPSSGATGIPRMGPIVPKRLREIALTGPASRLTAIHFQSPFSTNGAQ
jgi:hypothetical protein